MKYFISILLTLSTLTAHAQIFKPGPGQVVKSLDHAKQCIELTEKPFDNRFNNSSYSRQSVFKNKCNYVVTFFTATDKVRDNDVPNSAEREQARAGHYWYVNQMFPLEEKVQPELKEHGNYYYAYCRGGPEYKGTGDYQFYSPPGRPGTTLNIYVVGNPKIKNEYTCGMAYDK